MAKPVIATPQALEGIRAKEGDEVLIARDEVGFLDLSVPLLLFGDRRAVGENARSRVLADYQWSVSQERLLSLLDELLPLSLDKSAQ